MKRVPLVLAALLAQPFGTPAQVQGGACQAKIELTWHEQQLIISGHCRSLLDVPGRYRYQLLVVRQSRGGRSQNNQGGEFALPSRQNMELSVVRLSVQPDDQYQVHLTVFDLDGQAVAQDSTSSRQSGHL